jgi:periplasmic copper chaperone A
MRELRMIPRRLALLAPLFVCATPALSQTYTQGAIEVEHPWARPTTAQLGTAYLVLRARGNNLDRLLAAETWIANHVELRNAAGEGVRAIEILPGGPTTLAPGHPYLALVALHKPLKAGEAFPLLLHFEAAGDITVTVRVEETP